MVLLYFLALLDRLSVRAPSSGHLYTEPQSILSSEGFCIFTHDLSDIISSAHRSHFLAHSLHVWTALETHWKPLLSRLTAASSFYLYLAIKLKADIAPSSLCCREGYLPVYLCSTHREDRTEL
ncbi:hypothetical protein GDO78_014316 [Eleutherodactylus coqui]|uniref:Secreted protein n=1 Tax=Eleutherodactylus coqui TaxID=57060 RepID=A0A8J6EEY1_ELECQ|nr:hypothetical protein GDO78_014316 [Eleutherodactylus coqui]